MADIPALWQVRHSILYPAPFFTLLPFPPVEQEKLSSPWQVGFYGGSAFAKSFTEAPALSTTTILMSVNFSNFLHLSYLTELQFI